MDVIRYPPAQRLRILEYASRHGCMRTGEKFKMPDCTVRDWTKKVDQIIKEFYYVTKSDKAAQDEMEDTIVSICAHYGIDKPKPEDCVDSKPRVLYTPEFKLQVLDFASRNNFVNTAVQFNTSPTNVRDWTFLVTKIIHDYYRNNKDETRLEEMEKIIEHVQRFWEKKRKNPAKDSSIQRPIKTDVSQCGKCRCIFYTFTSFADHAHDCLFSGDDVSPVQCNGGTKKRKTFHDGTFDEGGVPSSCSFEDVPTKQTDTTFAAIDTTSAAIDRTYETSDTTREIIESSFCFFANNGQKKKVEVDKKHECGNDIEELDFASLCSNVSSLFSKVQALSNFTGYK